MRLQRYTCLNNSVVKIKLQQKKKNNKIAMISISPATSFMTQKLRGNIRSYTSSVAPDLILDCTMHHFFMFTPAKGPEFSNAAEQTESNNMINHLEDI